MPVEVCEQTQLPAASPAEVAFAEFPIPVPAPVRPTKGNNTVAVISANGITIEISNSISEPLLCMLLWEVHMLEDVLEIRRVVLVCGTVNLQKGINGLAMIIGDKYEQNPFEKGTLFLFCGDRSDRIKGLLWMGTGFLLLYKRFEAGRLSCPRTTQKAAELTEEQFHYLMMGLNPLEPKVKKVTPGKVY